MTRRAKNAPEPVSSWARYLREVKQRPGWSVARLSSELAEAGTPIGLPALFSMLADKYEKLSVKQVIAIARVLGDDLATVLHTAAELLPPEHADPLLWRLGLRADDPVVQKILRSRSFDDRMKTELLQKLSIQRAEKLAIQQEQEAAEIEHKEQIWNMGRKLGQQRR